MTAVTLDQVRDTVHHQAAEHSARAAALKAVAHDGAAEMERIRASNAVKLARAKELLGKNWVNHPDYKFTPRHSHHIHVWWPHRTLRGGHGDIPQDARR